MSLIKVFTDAVKKAAGKSAIDTKELARSSGGSLGSVPGSSAGAFDPLRPAPDPSPEGGQLNVDDLTATDGGGEEATADLARRAPDPFVVTKQIDKSTPILATKEADAGLENKVEGVGPIDEMKEPGTIEHPNLAAEDRHIGGIKYEGPRVSEPASEFELEMKAGKIDLEKEKIEAMRAGDTFPKLGDIKGESMYTADELSIAEGPDAGAVLARDLKVQGGLKVEADHKIEGDHKLEGLKAEPEYKPQGDFKHEGGIKFEGGIKGESTDDIHKLSLESRETTQSGADAGKAPDVPGQTSGLGAGKAPDDPGQTSGSGAGRPEGYTPSGGAGAGRPEGGEAFAGSKFEMDYKTAGVLPVMGDSSDPQEGGELTRGIKAETGHPYIGETEKNLTMSSSDPEEGGEIGGEDFFKVKIEDVRLTPAAPSPTPLPYPVSDDSRGDDDGGAGAFARLKGQEPKIESALGRNDSIEPPDGPPDDEGTGGADWIARKAGKGQMEYLEVKLSEAFVSREASSGIKGESLDHKHKEELEMSAGDEGGLGDDDDLESSTIVQLRPRTAAKEMLPGLGGEVSDEPDLDLDGGADADESEV